jgi:Na+/H+ antiporter NhaD/arsenite permease-like protein
MDRNAIIAVIIFVIAYGLIIAEALPRSIITFTGAVLLLLLGLIKDSQIVSVINWDAMGLIFGMFVLVRVLVESGFFDYLSAYVLKKNKRKPTFDFPVTIHPDRSYCCIYG